MFKVKEVRRNIPDSELIDDVKYVADKNSSNSVTIEQYNEHGNFHATTLTRRFSSWHNVLELAGLEQTRTRMGISSEDLLQNIAEVWIYLGRQPRYSDMTKEISKFSAGTYDKRFGSWNNSLREFSRFISDERNEEEAVHERNVKKISKRRTKRNVNWRLRAKVLIRDNCLCKMCGSGPAKDSDVVLHVDHIIPWSRDGETEETNLQTLCSKCNIGKSNMI